MKEVKTNYIVPVDLNCLMFMNYSNLSEFHSLLGDSIKAEEFADKAKAMQKAIQNVLWNQDDRMWYDFDLINNVSANSMIILKLEIRKLLYCCSARENIFFLPICFPCGPSATSKMIGCWWPNQLLNISRKLAPFTAEVAFQPPWTNPVSNGIFPMLGLLFSTSLSLVKYPNLLRCLEF